MSWTKCASCSASNRPKHKFCVHCGSSLDGAKFIHVNTKATVPVVGRRASSTNPIPAESERERRVRSWIENVLDEKLPDSDICTGLKSGVVLCKLLNKIRPGMISKINRVNQPFLQLENVSRFLLGARVLGVAQHEIFQAVDLFEVQRPARVVYCLWRLGECASTIPTFKGPYLNTPTSPKKAPSQNEQEAEADLSEIDQRVRRVSNTSSMDVDEMQMPGASEPELNKLLHAMPVRARRQLSQRLMQSDINSLQQRKLEIETKQQVRRLSADEPPSADDLQQIQEERKKLEIEEQLRLKKADADRIALIEKKSRELEAQNKLLRSNMKKQHDKELIRLQKQHEHRMKQMQAELDRSNALREAERRKLKEEAARKISELEQSLRNTQASKQSAAKIAELQKQLESVREESEKQLAVEKERVRLEADQRALEQIRAESEAAKLSISRQIKEQMDAELAALQARFDQQLMTKDNDLAAEIEARERAVREQYEHELLAMRQRVDVLSVSREDNNQVAAEERLLRHKLEDELVRLRAEFASRSEAEDCRSLEQQRQHEAQLRQEFDSEMARVQSVFKQRVQSEEKRHRAEQLMMQQRLQDAVAKLEGSRRQLEEAKAKVASSPKSDALDQTVAKLKAAVAKAEAEARIRAAVEAERDRFEKEVRAIEKTKAAARLHFQKDFEEMERTTKRQQLELERLQSECEHKEAALLRMMQQIDTNDAQNAAALKAANAEEEESRHRYEREIERLKSQLRDQSAETSSHDPDAAEQRVRVEMQENMKKLEEQLVKEQRALKQARAELELLKQQQQQQPTVAAQVQQRVEPAEQRQQQQRLREQLEQERRLRQQSEAALEVESEARSRAERELERLRAQLHAVGSGGAVGLEVAVPPVPMAPTAASGAPPAPPPPPPPAPPAPSAPAPPRPGGAAPPLPASRPRKPAAAGSAGGGGGGGGGDMRASLLAAIQGKPLLKKASERKLADPKPDTTKSNAKGGGGGGMMNMMNLAQMAAQMAAARKKRNQ